MSLTKEKQIEYIDRVTGWSLAGFVFILPIAHTMTIRLVLLYLPALFWLYKMALKREALFVKNQLTFPLVLFTAAAAISVIGAVNPAYSFRELMEEVVLNLLIFFMLLNNTRDMRRADLLMTGLLLSSLVQGAYGTYHYLTIGGDLLDYNVREGGLTRGAIAYSVFLITVIPFIFYKIMTASPRGRFLYLALLALNIFMLAATQQRGAWIAFAAEVSLFFWFAKKQALILAMGAAVLIYFLVPSGLIYHGKSGIKWNNPNENAVNENTNSINSRMVLWKFTLRELKDHPFKGIGIGRHSFSAMYPQYRNTTLWHAHNTFLDVALQLGVQGILAFIFVIFTLSRTYWTGYKKTQGNARLLFLASITFLMGFFIRNMFDDHYVDDNAQMFWVFSGMAVAVFLVIERLEYPRILLNFRDAVKKQA